MEQVDRQIVVTDRATLFNLLIGLDGYTVSSGILSERPQRHGHRGRAPLRATRRCRWASCSSWRGRPLSPVAARYVDHLRAYLAAV